MEDKERSNGRKGQLSELVLVAEIIDADRSSFGDGRWIQKGPKGGTDDVDLTRASADPRRYYSREEVRSLGGGLDLTLSRLGLLENWNCASLIIAGSRLSSMECT
jgi:hypothetical protein